MADARWSLRNIYLYVVCLITLIMVIVGGAGTIRSVAELAYPDPGYDYWSAPIPVKGEEPVSAEERAKQEEFARAQSVRQGVLNLAGNLAIVLIAGPIYLYHWRKIEMEHVDTPVEAAAPGV
ncbi:MAG TPA: hypothetical protein VLQ52_01750 [Coriobacteriia bacterium]|nr:hypothetical protein [Coriobacteriia bacterium]